MAEEQAGQLSAAQDASLLKEKSKNTEGSRDQQTQEQPSSKLSALAGGDLLRNSILISVVVLSVAVILLLVMWLKQPELRPLGDYSTQELIPILDVLDQQKISYQLAGNTVLVPMDQYNKIKLELSRAGLVSPVSSGDDILLQDMGFGVSQQMERERLKLSRERQLEAAIEEIRDVANARVLLAMPKPHVFVRHRQNASATVLLTVRGSTELGQQEVNSIVDLVASAVPSLTPARVSVTDQYGRLLNSGNQDAASQQQSKEYELERKQEQALRDKIDAILVPVLGVGNYTAQVDVSMDFSASEETQKRYDPNTQLTRSEFTRESFNSSDLVAGVPGALTNQPPMNSEIPEQVNNATAENIQDQLSDVMDYKSREATRNYELDTTISHKRAQTGVIDRQTVSVAVNYITQTDPNSGETTSTPVSDEVLDKIRRLLMGGVGYSEARGDVLEVISMSFVTPEEITVTPSAIWDHPNFNYWLRWGVGGLFMVLMLLLVVRPAMKKLLATEKTAHTLVGANGEILSAEGLPLNQDNELGLIGESDGAGGINLPNLNKNKDLLNAVRSLVENEPYLASQVIKGWVSETDTAKQ